MAWSAVVDVVRGGIFAPDKRGLLDSSWQLPPAAALYSAVRAVSARAGGFLWIKNLASSDRMIALVAGGAAAVAAWVSAATPAGRSVPPLAPVMIVAAATYLFLSQASTGFAINSIANSLIGAMERSLAARTIDRVRA